MSRRPRSIIGKARNFSTRRRQISFIGIGSCGLRPCQKNQSSLAVSSCAVLVRKGFLVDLLTVESHKRLVKLTRKGIKWVARWQKRHGLTRGRFRQGCGLTPEQQRAKVRRVNINFLSCGLFFRFRFLFLGGKNCRSAVRFLDLPTGLVSLPIITI